MTKIGVIGECMVEVFDAGDGQCQRSFGGDTLNTAVYLKRCVGDSTAVYYCTVLGDDILSDEMLASWRREGLEVSAVDRLRGSFPGLYMIQTDEQGERSFLYWRDRAPAKKMLQTPGAASQIAALMRMDWWYLSGISLAVLEPRGREKLFGLMAEFRQQGGQVAFDGNYRPRLWDIQLARKCMARAYGLCDIALPSVDDECALWWDADSASVLRRIEDFGCQEIVLKRGGDSCLLSLGGQTSEFPTQAVETVVDTTAAGDSFSAGYLSVRQASGSVADAVAVAQKISAQVIQRKGAIVAVTL